MTTTYTALINLADHCEELTHHTADVFETAFRLVTNIEVCGKRHSTTMNPTTLIERNTKFHTLCTVGGFLDAAMMLRDGVTWLQPIIDYSTKTVRLVNVLGIAVGGNDYLSKASTIELSLLASMLRAHAAQVDSIPYDNLPEMSYG